MLNKYPLWKNIFLLVLLLLGFIYAAPNLFPEQPAVQISPSTAIMHVDLEALQVKVNELIKTMHISPLSEELNHQTLLLRFSNTDTQLKAKDILASVKPIILSKLLTTDDTLLLLTPSAIPENVVAYSLSVVTTPFNGLPSPS